MISDLNRRIKVLKYSFGQDHAGGNIKTLLTSFDMWATVEPTNGNRSLDNLQITYLKSYRLTVRDEVSRPLYENDEIVYENNLFSIQSITRQKEGRSNYLKIDVYNTETTPVMITAAIGWSSSPFTTSEVANFPYQGSVIIQDNNDIIANYSNAPHGSYLILRYPKTQPTKGMWHNTGFNYGGIPDSVFQYYEDAEYKYAISRIDVALEAQNKKIIFS